MKHTRYLFIFLMVVLVVLVWPQTALAQEPEPPRGDKFVTGGSYTLASGQTLHGSLIVLGGNAQVEEDAVVTGDVLIAGGNLTVGGTVEGSILAAGGLISLTDGAVVQGDVTTWGGSLSRDPGAEVEGEVHTDVPTPFEITIPGGAEVPVPGGAEVPAVQVRVNPVLDFILKVFWFFAKAFLWAALAVLVTMFLTRQTELVAQTLVAQPLISVGLGLLTAVVAPLILVLIAITIIGIPVTLVGLMILVVAWVFGLISLGAEVGRRLEAMLNQEWPLAVAAGLGTFITMIVVNGIGEIPCVGWVAPLLAGSLGLGAVILSRFGTQVYPPSAPVGRYNPEIEAGM